LAQVAKGGKQREPNRCFVTVSFAAALLHPQWLQVEGTAGLCVEDSFSSLFPPFSIPNIGLPGLSEIPC
jgi:hypothetical protein